MTVHEATDKAAGTAGRFSSHLNESDSVLWSIERDPVLRTTIVAVSMLDRSPNWKRLRRRMDEACVQVPRLRQKVVSAPMRVGPPRWEDDEFFDVDYHLRRVVCPAPGDLRAVLDMAGLFAMAAFDKDRPLWEFTLVEGLADGGAALIQKVHHAFTDGVGGVKMAELLLDHKRAPGPPRNVVTGERPKKVGSLEAIVQPLVANARTATALSWRGAQAFPSFATAAVLRPDRAVGTTVRSARSIVKLLAPAMTPLSPVMVGRGLSRRFDAFDVPLADLLAAAHTADSTLNDAFLASITDGLRRYHERRGAPVTALRVTMPINLRKPGDTLGNNRFVPARLTIPIDAVDAAQRMQRMGALSRRWRSEPSLPLSNTIAGVLNRLPIAMTTAVFGGMLKAIDFVATNVPGLTHRVYLAGAEVTREYAFAPPSGAALAVALLSHGDQCCIGINIDTTAVPDADVLVACVREGFDDVLNVGAR
ncbi:MAG: WS/DGAT domain-containing protein [Ilumatobacteraceae bacterium]|nr:WS/DGAT domain-containing protein [Ilumatobacteraceae bacterium]